MALVAIAATSCSSDEVYDVYGNPNNIVYVSIAKESPEGMPKNTFSYKVFHTPVGSIKVGDAGDVYMSVKSTHNAQGDITATVAVDRNMTIEGYDILPENSGITVSLDETTLTIPAGTNTSNTIKVNVDATNADWTKLTKPYYILPIRVVSATSASGQKVVPSTDSSIAKSLNAVYVGVITEVKTGMLNEAADSPAGENITDHEGWTGTYHTDSDGWTGNMSSKLWDNNEWNYDWFIKNKADGVREEVVYTLDFGKTISIKGMRYHFYYSYYTLSRGDFYTSTDGVNFTKQGSITKSGNTTNWYFNLWSAMDVRAVRLVGYSYYGGTGEGQILAEINAYN